MGRSLVLAGLYRQHEALGRADCRDRNR